MKVTKTQLTKLVEEVIKRKLNEDLNNKIYIDGNYLWVSYSPGSGKTTPIKNLKSYWTDKKGHPNFDSSVIDIMKWAEVETPIKSTNKGSLFKIPKYDIQQYKQMNPNSDFFHKNLDVWGGDIKPVKYYYLTINNSDSGVHVVNIFDNKNEALNWIK